MIRRAMLVGLLSVAGTVNANEPDKNAERADRIRALQRQIMDLEGSARTRVLQALGVKPLPGPPINTMYNVENFTPVTARFVRFTVLATVNGAEPCLDALEMYSPESPANLTGSEGVRLTASSIWPGHLGDFKGGKYGKGWCWVAKERGTGWVQVEFPAPKKIARLVWSRDAPNRYHDRVPSVYKVEISADGRAWHKVATGEDHAASGHDPRFSRAILRRALDSAQQRKRQELTDELKKLGAPGPNDIQSGPQVGEGINGGFGALFLNGDHAGQQRCPV
jgi:hypothetical protein